MNARDERASADLADQAMQRTTAPGAGAPHGHGHTGDREHGEHGHEGHGHGHHDHEHHGYEGHGHDHHDHHEHEDHDHEHAFEWPEMLRIALVAVAAAAVWWRVWEPFSSVSVIGVAGLLIGGWPIFKEAFENLAAKRMTMELSMSIAIVAAAGISEFFTALVITLFVLIAEVLEGMTVSRGAARNSRFARLLTARRVCTTRGCGCRG